MLTFKQKFFIVLVSTLSTISLGLMLALQPAAASAKPQGLDALGNTALHQAVASANAAQKIRSLKAQGLDIEAKNKLGATPLFSAVAVGNTTAIQTLINLGADIHTTNRIGQNLAHMAAYMQHGQVLSLLKDKGLDLNTPSTRGLSPLHWAVEQNKIQGATSLVQLGADLNLRDKAKRTPLHIAAAAGSTELINMLVNTPVQSGPKANTEALLNRVADKLTAFCLAAEGSHLQAMKTLAQANANINILCRWRAPALHNALHDKHSQVVQTLIELGVHLEARDPTGATPLLLAVELGRGADVKQLLQAGANLQAQDRTGSQAVHIAANRGRLNELKQLHQAGAPLKVKDHTGSTPLHYAMQLKMIQFLHAQGLSLDALNTEGQSPLYGWISNTRVQEVQWALQQGVNLQLRDWQGQRPLDVARSVLKAARQQAQANVAEDNEDLENEDFENPTLPPELEDSQLDSHHLNEALAIVRLLEQA